MKRIFLIATLCLIIQGTFACDICGCSSGNYFIGPFPQFRKHFFGTRYTFRSFTSEVAGDPTQYSKDFYQTAELWGGLNIGKKWQVIAFIPYNFNRQRSDDGIKNSNGLGDITLIANYKLLDTRSNDKKDKRISQQLWIGGGAKLPTGKFNADPTDIIPDANNQPGTGSLDFLINTMYTFHVNDWGLNSNINYKINGSAEDFQFGNRFNASAFVFRSISTANTTFNPNVGLLYENLTANELDKVTVEDTGGYALHAAAGLETNFSNMAVGLNAQLPVSQHLSNGQTTSKVRGMVHLTFTF